MIKTNVFKTEEHESVATTLQNIAGMYDLMGEKENDLQTYEKVLSMRIPSRLNIFSNKIVF